MNFSLAKQAIVAIAVTTSLAVAPLANAATWKVGGASSVSDLMSACQGKFQTATGDEFLYSGTGSGDGKNGIHNGTFDWAFSDSIDTAPLANEIHLPTFIWPVAILINLGTVDKRPVNLSTATIAQIFSGTIKKWNDPAIVADNNRTVTQVKYRTKNGVTVKDKNGSPIVLSTRSVKINRTMPNQPITVYYRSKGSGTSNNLTRAFAAIAPSIWTKPANDLFATAFPGDVAKDSVRFRGGASSGDVANGVKATPYSITYAEVGFGRAPYNLIVADVINGAGNAITPNSDSAMAAAAMATVRADGTVAFNYGNTNPAAYPFTATTYALALTDYGSAAKAASVKKALDYLASKCAKDNPELGFGVFTSTNPFVVAFAKQLAKIGN